MFLLGCAASSVLLGGCEKNCLMGLPVTDCEGDVFVLCPQGHFNFTVRPEREDCRVKGQRCVKHEGGWASCEKPLGACETAAFTPRCVQIFPNESTGRMTQCSNGDELVAGGYCEVPKERVVPTLPP
jgi:hypothetical protein